MGNGLYHIFAGLVDEFGTAFRVGLSFFGVAFGEEGKELVVAGELCQVLTSCFDADARSALHVVGVDERKVIAFANFIVQNVGRRKIAMQKTAFVQMGRKARKCCEHVVLFVGRFAGEGEHVVAIVREQANEIGGLLPKSVPVHDIGY